MTYVCHSITSTFVVAHMPVGDVYEVKLYTVQGAQTAVNVRHFRVSAVSATTPADSAIADAFSNRYGPVLRPLMSTSAEFRGAGQRLVSTIPKPVETYSVAGAGPGTVAADPLPKQVCGLLTLRTAFAGRRYRGRIYVPFPAESDNDFTTRPIATYVTRLQTLGGQFTGSFTITQGANTMTVASVVFSRQLGEWSVVTGYTARSSWATQRRRGDFGRSNLSPV